MKLYFPLLLFAVSLYVYSCANQGTPTGGPKDTIPPTLTESYPPNKTINYKRKEFKFIFDEKINADKLKPQLLITPHIENKFNIKVKKNELLLVFENEFQDSTTYTLNFADGVVDVTEKNPAKNLSLAFSTGSYIDSIYVNGKITNLYNNAPRKEYIVGLYELTDTLDILKNKPKYFAKTNAQGQFSIENIKNGFYKIITFDDKNKNLTLEAENEAHGFLADSIDLSNSADSLYIPTQFMNANPLTFIRAKNTGRYFDIQYSKGILRYQIRKLDTLSNLNIPAHNLIKENKIIRLYPNDTFRYEIDSLGLIVAAQDSLDNSSLDTLFVKFLDSSRKPESFSSTLTPAKGAYIDPLIQFSYSFDKPINVFYPDSIVILYDTLKTQPIADSTFLWNPNKTQLTFEALLDRNYLKSEIDTLLKYLSDTSITDSISIAKKKYFQKVNPDAISIHIPQGTFISVENDSTAAINYNYTFKSLAQLGSVSGVINTTYSHFTLQLVNTQYKVIEESHNNKSFSFQFVKPGKYTFRVLIDTNADGKWSNGNILTNQPPEQVYFYPEEFDVRANWQLENIKISF